MKKIATVILLSLLFLLVSGCSKATEAIDTTGSSDNTTVVSRELKDTDLVAAVQVNGLWGYADITGKLVINPQFDYAENFSEGYAAVCKDGLYGYIDKTGSFAINPVFSRADNFQNGYACVKKDNIVFFIDRSGKLKFDIGIAYNDTDYIAGWGSCQGVTKNGYVICEYDEPVVNSNGGIETLTIYQALFDIKGNMIIHQTRFVSMSFATDDIIRVSPLDSLDSTFYDLKGNVIHPEFMTNLMKNTDYKFEYYCTDFYNGLTSVATTSGKWGCIDIEGNIIIEPNFNISYMPFLSSEGLMLCVDKNTGWGFADKTGNIVIDTIYTPGFCNLFSDGLASVELWKDPGEDSFPYYINKSGETVINLNSNATFDFNYDCGSFMNEYAIIIENDRSGKSEGEPANSKYGYIDTTGKFIIDCIFDDAKDFSYINNIPTEEYENLSSTEQSVTSQIATTTATTGVISQKINEVSTNYNNYISAGGEFVVALKTDGTVLATGCNLAGQCNVSEWTDIISVSAGNTYTVGLRSDGTVVTTGSNEYGQCDVSNWNDIVSVSAGYGNIIGLKSDGTVIAAGWNEYGQCDVADWADIVAISAGYAHTVGLKSDGTVVATGYEENFRNVEEWTNIVAISARSCHTIGLESDGTVIASGWNEYGQCDVSDWSSINFITTNDCTVGLTENGEIKVVGKCFGYEKYITDWDNIIAISIGTISGIGLMKDGTVVAIGSSWNYDVSNWNLFNIQTTTETIFSEDGDY